MKLKNGIIAGTLALVVAGVASVSYGATQQELCKKMWGPFQELRKVTGLMESGQMDGAKTAAQGKAILEDATTSRDSVAVDENYKVLNGEVIFHAEGIVKGGEAGDLEEIQVQFRRLTIACRNCHKIYQSERRLVP
ncbi:MAG: cytochrome c [Candidatus Brocadiaceae bacterium]|nr:cytochrome c [Candidatus Brocadiaceae bacterium]